MTPLTPGRGKNWEQQCDLLTRQMGSVLKIGPSRSPPPPTPLEGPHRGTPAGDLGFTVFRYTSPHAAVSGPTGVFQVGMKGEGHRWSLVVTRVDLKPPCSFQIKSQHTRPLPPA